MNLHISNLLSRPGTISQRLLLTHLQAMGKQEQRQALQTRVDVSNVPAAHLLELWVFGPDVTRPLEALERHALEAGLLEHLLVLRREVDRPPQVLGRFDSHDGHLVEEVIFRQCAVVAADWQGHVDHFQIAAWFEVAGVVQLDVCELDRMEPTCTPC